MGHVPWHQESNEPNEFDDTIELLSAGIDIGTTTSHVMISRLVASREGSYSKYHIQERAVVYEGGIFLTPYEDDTTIDENAIADIITRSYEDAGYEPDEIDTGAVIVTGEASRKHNAERISSLFSEKSGKFVCATAGPNLEAVMAAHGSGAVDLSLERGQDVLHVDIGGGTTKFASIVDGFVQATGSINVGARLLRFDEDDRVTYVEAAGRRIADDAGIDVEPGTTGVDRERLAERFAQLIFEVFADDQSDLTNSLLVTDQPDIAPFDIISFSGGVAEYVYDRNPGYFDDLGPQLGEAIRTEIEQHGAALAELEPGIRATAIGSTNHSVQISGNTIALSDLELLPLRNIPMVPFVADHHDDDLLDTILNKLELYDVANLNDGFAYGFHLHGPPSYEFIKQIVDASVAGWERMGNGRPLILAFDSDIAKTVGEKAMDQVEAPVVAVDGVELDQFGYIDIGEPLENTNGVAVPLTVKSLIFEG